MALSTTFGLAGPAARILTIIIGHATFCIVLVYNNAVARLRRTSISFDEASADLGADSFQTFRFVTFPALRSALIAGGLLAFALSFDEVIVTIFIGRRREDAADLDLPELPAGQPGPAGQRRRSRGDPAVGDPGLPGDTAQWWRGQLAGLTAQRRRSSGATT